MKWRLVAILAVASGLLLGQDGAMRAWWIDNIKTPLTKPSSAAEFNATYEGTLMPPPGVSFNYFKGKIISLTPSSNPKEIVLAILDPAVPDAKLVFRKALAGTMALGSELRFRGIPKSLSQDPFMVTFDMDDAMIEGPELIGWTGAGTAKQATKK
jgi:hypothetical protein